MTHYTKSVLCLLRNEALLPEIVAVGNELTNGLLWPYGKKPNFENIVRILNAGIRAVRETAPEAKTMRHLDNGGNNALYRNWFDSYFACGGLDFDYIGLSYYPFWHGTMEDLRNNMHDLARRYGKEMIVAEVSTGFSMEDYAAWEKLEPEQRKGMATKPELAARVPYPMTPEGQSAFVQAVMETIRGVPDGRGKGFVYWEPAWIPVPGCGWASSYSADYDPDDARVYCGGSACDNQALFDAEGNPLESLKNFAYVRTRTDVAARFDSVEPVSVTVKLNNEIILPETVPAIYNNGAVEEVPVIWDETVDLASISASQLGTYPVRGIAQGAEVTCCINMVEENYVTNYSFEDADTSMWRITEAAPTTDFQNKATDAHTGSISLHFWNAKTVEFTAEQDITGLREGEYTFSIQAQGGNMNEDAYLCIYAISDGVRYEQIFTVNGWVVWQNPTIEKIPCSSGQMTIGVSVQAAGGAWGTLDDFLLNPSH